MRRNRIIYVGLILLVIVIGLASRSHSPLLPYFFEKYAGDTLWALAAYLLIATLFPRMSSRSVAAAAALFSLAVEVSQLYHAPWIDQIRRTKAGGLVLGFGFLWSDLLCYAAGIGIGLLAESCAAAIVRSDGRPRSA